MIGPFMTQRLRQAFVEQKAEWRRSSRCSASGCLEIAEQDDRIAIRDSIAPEETVLVSRADFRTFIEGVKSGDFDDL
jgi:hypothetical protein